LRKLKDFKCALWSEKFGKYAENIDYWSNGEKPYLSDERLITEERLLIVFLPLTQVQHSGYPPKEHCRRTRS